MNEPNFTHCQPQTLLETVQGEQGIFLELCEIFMRESRSKLLEMQAAAAAGDLPKLGRQGHSLKGTVGPMAADKLVRMLQALEEDCQRGQCDGAARVAEIEAELQSVSAEVQRYIERR